MLSKTSAENRHDWHSNYVRPVSTFDWSGLQQASIEIPTPRSYRLANFLPTSYYLKPGSINAPGNLWKAVHLELLLSPAMRLPLTNIRILQIPHLDRELVLIFVGLVFIPVAILGYFSWRTIESERKLSEERLRESYRQVASLAGREIDQALQGVAEEWTSATERILRNTQYDPKYKDVERLVAGDPLIIAGFMLSSPASVVYPLDADLGSENSKQEPFKSNAYVQEFELFRKLKEEGENFEYQTDELDKALQKYKEIQDRLSNRQLQAISKSYVGRVKKKKGDWDDALQSFQELLRDHPTARDLNNMSLRFLAQYQIAICLENLGRGREALDTLVNFSRDLANSSGAINSIQYSFFLNQIQNLARRLLSLPVFREAEISDYRNELQELAALRKKRLSEKYFLHLLSRQLNKMVLSGRAYRDKFYYASDRADETPYLLAYKALPDEQGVYTQGLLGFRIDLTRLGEQILPQVLRQIRTSDHVVLAILNVKNDFLFGALPPGGSPIATQFINPPFDFWQVAIYLNDSAVAVPSRDWTLILRFWLTVLLLLCILMGGFLFVRKAWRESVLSRMKSDFVSRVSHEFRTPLASINMLAELLEMQQERKQLTTEKRARGYLTVIRQECDRLNHLVKNILDFSKIDKGMQGYTLDLVNLSELTEDAVEAALPFARTHGFKINCDIPHGLPRVLGDSDAISQAILNLLTNAIKYSASEKAIWVTARRQEGAVAIEVADHGIGIADFEIPKIFKEFYRVDNRLSSTRQGGLGLGLSLVQDIVSAHGGEVRVKSKIGRGSIFTILLPIPVQQAEAASIGDKAR